MTATACTNGKPQRRQLADQLDRLDGIIDALAEGLNQAVADACREGTRLAVRDAIVEILTNPELRALLAAPLVPVPAAAPTPATPPEPKGPGPWSRLRAKVAATREAVTGAAARATGAVLRRCARAGSTVAALGRATGEVVPVRRVFLVGLGVGLGVAGACLLVPQTTAAAVAGAGAGCTAVSAQVGHWLVRAARRVGLLG